MSNNLVNLIKTLKTCMRTKREMNLCFCMGIHLSAHLIPLLALFPGSPLAKNRKGGGEPGIDPHMIPQHDDVTAIIA